MPFCLACGQLRSTLGEVQKNLDHLAESLLQAESEGADLVVFPEAIVSGYFLEGANLECALTPADLLEEVKKRLPAGPHPDAVIGFYEKVEGRPCNSAAYLDLKAGEVVSVHRKFFLPTYGVFDEARFVQPGHEIRAFDTRFGRVGMLICEDVWHSVLSTLLAVQGADLILVPAASPARGFQGDKPSNVDRYERMLHLVADEHGVYSASACHVGFEGGRGLAGGSFIFDPFGRKLAEGPLIEEALILAECDLDVSSAARAQAPLLSDLKSRWHQLVEIASKSLEVDPVAGLVEDESTSLQG